MELKSMSQAAALGGLVAATAATPAQGGFGDLLKQFGAFDFGGTEFDTSEMQGNQKSRKDRERWVKEALDTAYQALTRADEEINLFDFQNYISVLNIEWTPDSLTNPDNIGNLNA
jgi:hypothetical protein